MGYIGLGQECLAHSWVELGYENGRIAMSDLCYSAYSAVRPSGRPSFCRLR